MNLDDQASAIVNVPIVPLIQLSLSPDPKALIQLNRLRFAFTAALPNKTGRICSHGSTPHFRVVRSSNVTCKTASVLRTRPGPGEPPDPGRTGSDRWTRRDAVQAARAQIRVRLGVSTSGWQRATGRLSMASGRSAGVFAGVLRPPSQALAGMAEQVLDRNGSAWRPDGRNHQKEWLLRATVAGI